MRDEDFRYFLFFIFSNRKEVEGSGGRHGSNEGLLCGSVLSLRLTV